MKKVYLLSFAILLAITVICFVSYQMGRTKEREELAINAMKVVKRQADEAINRPNPTELVDRLREGKF